MSDVLTVNDLRVEFDIHGGIVKAVDGVSFRVPERGTVALVGESGSGKSVVSQAIMGILPRPAKLTGGEILFHDPNLPPEHPRKICNLAALSPESRAMRSIRGGRISIIFQD